MVCIKIPHKIQLEGFCHWLRVFWFCFLWVFLFVCFLTSIYCHYKQQYKTIKHLAWRHIDPVCCTKCTLIPVLVLQFCKCLYSEFCSHLLIALTLSRVRTKNKWRKNKEQMQVLHFMQGLRVVFGMLHLSTWELANSVFQEAKKELKSQKQKSKQTNKHTNK